MSSTTVKKSVKSIMISFVSQIIIIALGLLLPRLLIKSFGSEVNGFFSTSTQLYSYLEILRAGVGMAAIQALYKPIADNKIDGISKIISTSKAYFRRIGFIYLGLTGFISIAFVLVGNKYLSDIDVFIIVATQGIAGWISFSQINWFIDLLRAEGKNYVFVSIHTIGTVAIKLAEILLIYLTFNPVLVKSASLIIVIVEYFVFLVYRRKYYSMYDFKAPVDLSLLKNRKSYLVFHISSLICTNTDIIVLSIFCGYEISSVYSVYFMVVVGVNAIINTIYSSTSFILGHSFQRGIKYFTKVHDTFYLVYTTFTTSLFSICYILLIPFIRLYTLGIEDVNYIYTYLPLLFCIIQIITCGKNVGDMTVNIGGLARNVVWRSIMEALINIVVSIVLVQFIGLYGVLVGTIVATLYRLIDVLWFSNRRVLMRSPIKNILVLLLNFTLFFVVVFFNNFFNIEILNYWDFLKFGGIITPIVLIIYFGIMLLANPTERKMLTGILELKTKG